MDYQEKNTNHETPSTPILKPATEMAKTASMRQLKIVELIEQCQATQTTLAILNEKVKELSASKTECEKLLSDYEARDRINLNNSESLFQAKAQLNKYKCELKCEYLMMQKRTRENKAKYDSIVSSYKSKWESTLDLYNSDPTVRELHQIQEENQNLQNEIFQLENLIPDTIEKFSGLRKTLENQIREKILLFCQRMIDYNKFVKTRQLNREAQLKDGGRHITIFSSTDSKEKDSVVVEEIITDDILELENSVLPKANLENQLNDDDLFMTIIMDELPKDDNHMRVSESFEGTNDVSEENFREQEETQKKTEEEGNRKGPSDRYSDILTRQSEYFSKKSHWHNNEQSKQTKEGFPSQNHQIDNLENYKEKPKPKNMKRKKEDTNNKRKTNVDKPEVEESISNTSSEFYYPAEKKQENYKQAGPRSEGEGQYDFQYRNKSPECLRQESVPFFVNNPNESLGSPSSNLNLKSDEDQSFKGFFMMGNEQNSPTPSIFKLF